METLSRNQERVLTSIATMGKNITALSLMRKVQEQHNLTINWHVLASILDQLARIDVLTVTGHDNTGMTVYKVKGE